MLLPSGAHKCRLERVLFSFRGTEKAQKVKAACSGSWLHFSLFFFFFFNKLLFRPRQEQNEGFKNINEAFTKHFLSTLLLTARWIVRSRTSLSVWLVNFEVIVEKLADWSVCCLFVKQARVKKEAKERKSTLTLFCGVEFCFYSVLDVSGI